jgi:hypothetical protein
MEIKPKYLKQPETIKFKLTNNELIIIKNYIDMSNIILSIVSAVLVFIFYRGVFIEIVNISKDFKLIAPFSVLLYFICGNLFLYYILLIFINKLYIKANKEWIVFSYEPLPYFRFYNQKVKLKKINTIKTTNKKRKTYIQIVRVPYALFELQMNKISGGTKTLFISKAREEVLYIESLLKNFYEQSL